MCRRTSRSPYFAVRRSFATFIPWKRKELCQKTMMSLLFWMDTGTEKGQMLQRKVMCRDHLTDEQF